MSEVVAFNRVAARRGSRRAIRMAIVAQIIEALEALGGQAHYDRVIEHIARERKLKERDELLALRRQVLDVFKDHCEPARPSLAEQAVFRRVYGPDSRRWGFAKAFHDQLRAGVIDLEQQVS